MARAERIQERAVRDEVRGVAEARINKAFISDGVNTHCCVTNSSEISEA